MQNRSLLKLVLLNFFTLGLYELVWLAETRQEMVSKFGLQLPAFKKVLFVKGFQATCYISAVAALMLLIPFLNGKVSTAPDNPIPPQQCTVDYAAERPITDTCRKMVDTYYGTTSPKEKYSDYLMYTLLGIIGVIVLATLSLLIYVRWLKSYALGVMAVTNAQISQTKAINYLTLLPPTMGMLLLQSAYNDTSLNSSAQV